MPARRRTPVAGKSFITIEIGDLLSQGGELGDALVSFLEEKLPKGVKISRAENEVYVRSEGGAPRVSKTQLRVYLKRFLHLNDLRDDLKVTSRSKDRFAIIEFTTVIYE